MKKLYLLRHAKSSWEHQVKDFDRPLLYPKGFKQCKRLGKLALGLVTPDHIISSPAKRALSTARLFAEKINYPLKKIEENHSIYHSSHQTLLNEVNKIDDQFNNVMLVGHNPGISDFTTYLVGETIYFTTSDLAIINFDVQKWNMISANLGMLNGFLEP